MAGGARNELLIILLKNRHLCPMDELPPNPLNGDADRSLRTSPRRRANMRNIYAQRGQ